MYFYDDDDYFGEYDDDNVGDEEEEDLTYQRAQLGSFPRAQVAWSPSTWGSL